MSGWDPLIDRLADALIEWNKSQEVPPATSPTAPSSATTPQSSETTGVESESSEGTVPYTLDVLEIFSMEESLTIQRPSSSTSVAVDLVCHGFLAKTPHRPEVAVGFRTLQLFHRIRLRKPSMSVEAFTRVMCDYYMVCGLHLDPNIPSHGFFVIASLPTLSTHGSVRNL